ncbi:ribonuclease HII [Candidatus Roizmanbacteria bacterium]|nr:ribonuclease HII [Candidatus Roizmanbacteria bacterium]
MKKSFPTFFYERRLWKKGYCVIGIDEVGRGALAGPLVVGAACFESLERDIANELERVGINDSKKLTPRRRAHLSRIIREKVTHYSVAEISPSIINKYGIVKAFATGSRKAIRNLRLKDGLKKYLLVDAYAIKYLQGIGLKNQKAIIHGDEKSISIAAASIIAKVHRDRLMRKFHRQHPRYKWKKNKGYGTKEHREALKNYGKTKHHRVLFLRKLLKEV